MQIVPYQPAHLPGLYEVYRQTTANVPHCRFIPSLKYTGLALARAEQAGAGLLVAEDHGAVRGVATLRPVAPAADGVPQLEITGLFAPEERTATVLLEACLSRAKGARRLVAFPAEHGHCPMPAYNAGWDGLSDKMPSVARVLARHGFAPTWSAPRRTFHPRPCLLRPASQWSRAQRMGIWPYEPWPAIRRPVSASL
jgi:hypothetical protein